MLFCSQAAQELFSPGYLRKTELPHYQYVALINSLSMVFHLLAAPQSGYPAWCLKFIGESFAVSRLQIITALLLEFDARNKDSSRNKGSFSCLNIWYNGKPLNTYSGTSLILLHLYGNVKHLLCLWHSPTSPLNKVWVSLVLLWEVLFVPVI